MACLLRLPFITYHARFPLHRARDPPGLTLSLHNCTSSADIMVSHPRSSGPVRSPQSMDSIIQAYVNSIRSIVKPSPSFHHCLAWCK